MQADDKNKKIIVSEFESGIDSKILESIYKGADWDNHDDDSDNQDFLSNNLLTEREQHSPDANNNQRCYDEDEESAHVYLDNMDMYEDSDVCEEWDLNADIESMYKPFDAQEVIEQVMDVQILVNKMLKEDPNMAKKYRFTEDSFREIPEEYASLDPEYFSKYSTAKEKTQTKATVGKGAGRGLLKFDAESVQPKTKTAIRNENKSEQGQFSKISEEIEADLTPNLQSPQSEIKTAEPDLLKIKPVETISENKTPKCVEEKASAQPKPLSVSDFNAMSNKNDSTLEKEPSVIASHSSNKINESLRNGQSQTDTSVNNQKMSSNRSTVSCMSTTDLIISKLEELNLNTDAGIPDLFKTKSPKKIIPKSEKKPRSSSAEKYERKIISAQELKNLREIYEAGINLNSYLFSALKKMNSIEES